MISLTSNTMYGLICLFQVPYLSTFNRFIVCHDLQTGYWIHKFCVFEGYLWWWWWWWFNERTVQLRTLPLVPSPTGPHTARGDSGVCMCIHVCLVWSVFPTAFSMFRVPYHLPVCRQLHTNSQAQLDSIWTWRNAHMRSKGSSPTENWTWAARLAVQCSTNWATPFSYLYQSNWNTVVHINEQENDTLY